MSFNGISAQEECDTPIAVLMAERIDGMNEVQQEYLRSKMEQLVASQGISSDFFYTQFFLTADVVGMQNEAVPTIPASATCQCDIILKLVDRVGMKIMATQVVNVRGVGATEAKAIRNAIRLINPQNKKLLDFIKGAKVKFWPITISIRRRLCHRHIGWVVWKSMKRLLTCWLLCRNVVTGMMK